MTSIVRCLLPGVLLLCILCLPSLGQETKPRKGGFKTVETRAIFTGWLEEMEKALKEDYYDSNYKGIDLKKRFAAARERIGELDYDWQMYRVLVQVLMDFDDSHTYVVLPPREERFDYGFSMQMIGSDCLVTVVKPGGGAEAAGLAVGDRVLKVGKLEPSRGDLWKLFYIIYRLDPINTVQLTVQRIDGTEKVLTVKGKIISSKEDREDRKRQRQNEETEPVKCVELNKDIIACKLRTFSTEKSEIDKMMKRVAGYQKLILDLRGNGGGSVEIEEHLTGYFFERDVKIADMKRRKKTENRVARSKGSHAFKGELSVLVDSDSASASEIFARVIQIEKRGRVLGDVTSGSVMTSYFYPVFKARSLSGATDRLYPLFISVTIGDVIMSDGGKLEKQGVIPDIPLIPTGSALNLRMDPVLAVASTIFGHDMTPEAAGKFFFIMDKSTLPEDMSTSIDPGQ